MQTTVGQILVNDALPEDMRDYSRVIDKKSMSTVMERLATEHPDKFKDVVHKLYTRGASAAFTSGSSFSPSDFIPPATTSARLDELRKAVRRIAERDIPDDEKKTQMGDLLFSEIPKFEEELLARKDSRLVSQVVSGSRGGAGDLRSMLLGDFLVTDHRDNVIPVPILRGYAAGLSPAEYFAGSYGARMGTIATKFNTQRAGFFGKQLTQAAHRQVISSNDCDTARGIQVEGDDDDNVGAVLSSPVTVGSSTLAAGTVIRPEHMKHFKGKDITVRSALTCDARYGLCAKCVGMRETGDFPEVGENVGVQAATSLTEPVSQGQLSTKHGGGRATGEEGKLRGFDLANQLVQIPSSFKDAASLATVDGVVSAIDPAPQGGNFIVIGAEKHYVPAGVNINVRPGQSVEAGDVLSAGIPNPGEIVRYKGIGEGRYRFMKLFRQAYKDSGWKAHRRNIEVLTRGLINNARVTDLDGVTGALPDDIIEYDTFARNYEPRYGSMGRKPKASLGSYLEKPVMHYSIGTRITPSIATSLDKNGIKEIIVNKDEPSFQPEMVRVMESLSHSPDWQLRFGGSYLKRGLVEAVERGRSSEIHQTSYIPSLAEGVDFGKSLRQTGKY